MLALFYAVAFRNFEPLNEKRHPIYIISKTRYGRLYHIGGQPVFSVEQ
jgi:hypothetical protein